jgi:hypothetical protein
MSANRKLARRALRGLADRLERLQEALQGLAGRLRESIARLVGDHAGEAIREAIWALLEGLSSSPQGRDLPRTPYRADPFQGGDSRGAAYGAGLSWDRRDPYRDEPRRDWLEDREEHDDWGGGYGQTERDGPLAARFPGWWALLPPALHLAGWGLRKFPPGPRLVGAVGVGAAAAVAAVTVGPLAGILTAAAGAVVLLTALADGVAEATGDLASTLER